MLRKIIRYTSAICLTLVAIGLVAGASVAVWVITGPKSVSKFLPYVESSLNPEGATYRVDVGDAVMAWRDWSSPLDFRLKQVSLSTLQGRRIVTFPELSIGLDWSSLMLGDVQPRTIVIYQPSLWFWRDEEGRFSLGFDENDAEQRVALDNFAASEGGDTEGLGASPLLSTLESVRISSARLRLGEPGQQNALLQSPDADILLKRVGQTIFADVGFSLQQQSGQDARIQASAQLANRDQMLNATIRLNQLNPQTIAHLLPETWQSVAMNVPFTGEVGLQLNRNGQLTQAKYKLDGENGVLTAAEHFPKPLPITHIHIEGEGKPNLQQWQISQAQVDFGGARLSVNAQISPVEANAEMSEPGKNIAVRAVAEGMPVNDLAFYWPLKLNETARDWVTSNIREGVVPRAEARVTLENWQPGHAVPEDAVDVEIQVQGAEVAYLAGYPKVEAVDAIVAFTGKSMIITSQKGQMLEGAQLQSAKLVIPDLTAPKKTMAIDLEVAAPAADVVRYLSAEPLGFAQPLSLNADSISGSATGSLRFRFNLPSEHLGIEPELDMKITAQLNDVAQPGFLGYMDASGVSGALEISRNQLDYDGQLAWDGVPLAVDLTHLLGQTDEPYPTQYTASGTVPAEKLGVFGLPDLPFLSGAGTMQAQVKRASVGIRNLNVQADLTGIGVDLAQIGLVKPVGQAAQLTLSGDVASGAIALQSIAATSDGIHLHGSLAMKDNMTNLQILKLDRVEFADNNFAATVQQLDDGGYRIRAKGPSLGLQPYFSKRKQGEKRNFVKLPFTLDVHGEFDWVVIGKERELRQVNAQFICNTNWCESAAISGLTGQANEFLAEIGRVDGQRRMMFRTANAGSFFKAMDIYDGMSGGELTIGAVFQDEKPDRPLVGKLRITDNTIREVPFLARIASLMSLTGIADSLSGKGVSLNVIEGDFAMNEQYVTLSNGKAVGPAMGVSVEEGRINRVTDDIWLSGTFVPSYTLNTALGNIPVVGEALTGGRGEGMFAAKFTVEGQLPDQTKVDVNGLSMLAPGFLRKLVGGKEAPEETAPAAPAVPATN